MMTVLLPPAADMLSRPTSSGTGASGTAQNVYTALWLPADSVSDASLSENDSPAVTPLMNTGDTASVNVAPSDLSACTEPSEMPDPESKMVGWSRGADLPRLTGPADTMSSSGVDGVADAAVAVRTAGEHGMQERVVAAAADCGAVPVAAGGASVASAVVASAGE